MSTLVRLRERIFNFITRESHVSFCFSARLESNSGANDHRANGGDGDSTSVRPQQAEAVDEHITERFVVEIFVRRIR